MSSVSHGGAMREPQESQQCEAAARSTSHDKAPGLLRPAQRRPTYLTWEMVAQLGFRDTPGLCRAPGAWRGRAQTLEEECRAACDPMGPGASEKGPALSPSPAGSVLTGAASERASRQTTLLNKETGKKTLRQLFPRVTAWNLHSRALTHTSGKLSTHCTHSRYWIPSLFCYRF